MYVKLTNYVNTSITQGKHVQTALTCSKPAIKRL